MNEVSHVRNDTNFLRFLAIILIINSHLKDYYPIPFFATGGAIGNSLFLILSSLGLLLSERKNPKNFIEFYSKRIIRIYPPIWVIIVILMFPIKIYKEGFEIWQILPFAADFFYPPFWFLRAIMIYYIASFFLIKNYSTRKMLFSLFIILILYTFCYSKYLDLSYFSALDDGFSFIFYFTIFVFGIYLGNINSKIKYSGFQDYLLLFLSISIIYFHKYLMTKNVSNSFQIIQLLFLFPTVYYFLKISRSDLIQKRIMELPMVSNFINYMSAITLELYIVHNTLVDPISEFNIAFPMNIIVLVVISFLFAALINLFSKCIFFSR